MSKKSQGHSPVPYLPSIGRLLGFASRATTELSEQRLQAHDLTIQQWIILTALWRRDEMMISELATYCRVKEPTASSLVDRMEVKKLVNRHRDATDKRKVVVGLTNKGKSLSHLIDFYEEINAILLKGITKKEEQAFIKTIEKMIGNAEAAQANRKKNAE